MKGHDYTLRFSEEKGFGKSLFIVCPVCWNASIKVTSWEDGTTSEEECLVCLRRQRGMNARQEPGPFENND